MASNRQEDVTKLRSTATHSQCQGITNNVSMPVLLLYRLQQYLPVEVVPSPSNELVEVSVHELEYQRQSAGGLVVQHLF